MMKEGRQWLDGGNGFDGEAASFPGPLSRTRVIHDEEHPRIAAALADLNAALIAAPPKPSQPAQGVRKGKLVTGPFSVEAVPAPTVLSLEDSLLPQEGVRAKGA